MVDAIARGLALSVKKNQPITTYDNKSSFPEVGNDNMIYIDKDNQEIYFWDSKQNEYVVLKGGSEDPTPIIKKVIEESIIYGGDADDE